MRILWRATRYAIIGLAIVFAIDWGVFELRRMGGGGMGSVAVDQFRATALKGNRSDYDFLGTINENCSKSLFPQYAATQWNPPCWWLERHRTQWQYVEKGRAFWLRGRLTSL